MKTLIAILVSVVFISTCFAQQDLRYENELTFKGDIAYFKDKPFTPFTGLLVDSTTNKRLGEYKDGHKNGMFIELYTNGKKKNEGKYIYGAKDGAHIEWYENGNKKSEIKYSNGVLNGQYFEWFEGRELKSDIMYQNGKSIKEAFYKSGMMKDGVWKTDDGYTRKDSTYRDGELISVANYSNGVLDGKQIEYWANGKTKETTYQNGEKISEGDLIDGKQDGKWTFWSNNGNNIIERTYVDGNLIKEETKIVANLISNFRPSNNSFLFRTREDNKVFFQFDFKLQNTDGNTINVINTIKANLSNSKRLSGVTVDGEDKDESINCFIECTNINVNYNTKKCQTYDLKTKKVLSEYSINIPTIEVSVVLKDMERRQIASRTYRSTATDHIDNICQLGYNNPNFKQNAFDATNGVDYLMKFINEYFPVKTIIASIEERNKKGEIESVSIRGGDDIGISKSNFYVYEETGNGAIGILKVKKVFYGSTLCKVIEGGNIISSKLASGAKLIVVSTPD